MDSVVEIEKRTTYRAATVQGIYRRYRGNPYLGATTTALYIDHDKLWKLLEQNPDLLIPHDRQKYHERESIRQLKEMNLGKNV
tara:strand:+ start:1680 stop:1928 length:249 start_codon:yes stop_codon:yes gene_type:complete